MFHSGFMRIRIPIFTREPISSHITFLSKDKAVLYTRAAEQKVLAGGAMTLLSIEQK